MSKKLLALGAVACALGGAAVERAYVGSGTTVAVSEKESDKILKNIVTKKHEEDRPDGTKIIDSTTTDNTEIMRKIVETVRIQEAAKVTNWEVAAGYDSKRIYSLSVDRRVLGPITIGAGYSLNGIWQGRVGVQF